MDVMAGMITMDEDKCMDCGICMKYLGGYCIEKKDGSIHIDYSVCNECQKCIALCPGLAFSNHCAQSRRIDKTLAFTPDDFMDLLRRRRTIRHFTNKNISKEMLERTVSAAQYAPTMNKKIEVIVINDPGLIQQIDEDAMRYYRKLYKLLYSSKILIRFFQLFSDTLPIIKRKMERDLKDRKQIIKDNTQALIILLGNKKVPLTESSAQYYLANMLLFCEVSDLGSCLMDSLKISINNSRMIKEMLHIPKNLKILGVLALGYPEENIMNIPEGYQMKIGWNMRCS